MAIGVTPEGYVLKTQAEINADAEADLAEVKDPISGQELQADFSDPTDIVTQITAVPLEGVGIAFEQNQTAYNAFDPGKATNDTLSNLVLLNGLTRREASRSTVLLDFTGTALAIVVAPFQVTDVNREFTWSTTENIIFDGGGNAVGVSAQSDTLGDVTAPANSLDRVVSSNSDISSVDNPSDAVVGVNEETNETLRQRRDQSTEKPANGLPEAINANILEVTGVTFSREYTNNDIAVDANGINPKTLAVVVVGGDDAEVARAILQSLTAGQDTQGNTTVQFEDSLTNVTDINFFRPVDVIIEISIDIILTGDEPFPDNGVDLIKQALVDYSTGGARALGINDDFNSVGFPPGQDVIYTRLYTPINSVPGHQVDSLLINAFGDGPGVIDVTIDFNEVSLFQLVNIAVTVL